MIRINTIPAPCSKNLQGIIDVLKNLILIVAVRCKLYKNSLIDLNISMK